MVTMQVAAETEEERTTKTKLKGLLKMTSFVLPCETLFRFRSFLNFPRRCVCLCLFWRLFGLLSLRLCSSSCVAKRPRLPLGADLGQSAEGRLLSQNKGQTGCAVRLEKTSSCAWARRSTWEAHRWTGWLALLTLSVAEAVRARLTPLACVSGRAVLCDSQPKTMGPRSWPLVSSLSVQKCGQRKRVSALLLFVSCLSGCQDVGKG